MKHIFISILLLGFSIEVFCQTEITNKMQSNRYERGWKKLKEIDGEAGEKVIESLKDISPELGIYY
ncbi:hypothetical protein [Chryseobacterium indologenes]|uniref:hypothetical protein n=1 Tax=Chryseobacterium indologenes TaxID=253 RepID=UPI001E29D77A|nr:hypothetical protein [Chryseobacterium indologenes]